MWQLVLIVALAGFLVGVAYADFVVTWKQRHHISVDAIFLTFLSIFCAGGAVVIAHLPN